MSLKVGSHVKIVKILTKNPGSYALSMVGHTGVVTGIKQHPVLKDRPAFNVKIDGYQNLYMEFVERELKEIPSDSTL